MSKSITIQQPRYDECIALINREGGDHLYTVSVDGEIMTLPGTTMRGFLLSSDAPDWFMRF